MPHVEGYLPKEALLTTSRGNGQMSSETTAESRLQTDINRELVCLSSACETFPYSPSADASGYRGHYSVIAHQTPLYPSPRSKHAGVTRMTT